MKITELEKIVVDALEDIKARDIEVIDTTKLTPLFERVIVATGDSGRQVRALANHVREKLQANGVQILSTEGEENGEWVLVDSGDIVVHIMQPAIRTYYSLEELWGGKGPARVRQDTTQTKAVE